MTRTPSFRAVEQLSAYLDGQLKPSEVTRLEARLRTDPELAAILQDLRQARGILRQLPQRRAPRNFTLTPKMIGLKPPMPRSYPAFRLATALATLMLFFTFATNFMAPRMVRTAPPNLYGIGGGGGGDGMEPELAIESAPAEELPAMEEPAAPDMIVPPQPTLGTATADDNARVEPTLQPSEGENLQSAPADEPFVQKSAPSETMPKEPPVPKPPFDRMLQIALASIAILSALIAFILRTITIRKWRTKIK